MRKIESIEDQMKGVVTYEMSDGQRVRLDASAVREIGAGEMLRGMGLGHLLPTGRIPVMYLGEMVGTVPADFDPATIASRSFMYDPRPGDFVRDGNKWIASKTLGPGDLECVSGFVPG